MRVLAIESSCPRGTVALRERDRTLVRLEHDTPQAHAESLLPLIERALEVAGWRRSALERIGVGVGPGSFTGLRVGISLAQGLALGLGVPAVGVGSLAAMAAGLGSADQRIRCPILDARRDEVFVAAYDSRGRELIAPRAVARDRASAAVSRWLAETTSPECEHVFLGEYAATLRLEPAYRSPSTDFPDARCTARLAQLAREPFEGLSPHYVRDADAKLPSLPASPLSRK